MIYDVENEKSYGNGYDSYFYHVLLRLKNIERNRSTQARGFHAQGTNEKCSRWFNKSGKKYSQWVNEAFARLRCNENKHDQCTNVASSKRMNAFKCV